MDQINELTIRGVLETLKTLPKTIKLIFRIEKKYLLLLLFFSFIIGILPIISLYFSQELINSISNNKEQSIIIQNLIIFSTIGILSGVITKLYSYIDNKFSMMLGFKINLLLFEKISKLNLSDFEDSTTYNKIEKITQESSYKPFQIIKAIISMITSIITLILSIIYVSIWNKYVAIILLIIPLTTVAIFLKMGQKEFIVRWNRANRERKTWYWMHILTHDFSYKEIKLNGISDYIIKDFSNLKREFIKEDLLLTKQKNIINLLFEIILQGINVTIMILVIFSIKAGKLFVGNFVAIMQSVNMINENSQEIIEGIYIIYNSSLFMNEFFEFIDTELEENKIVKSYNSEPFDYINVKNVSYLYKDSNQGIRNINLKLNKGELVAIVGKNGSGKSTLTKILSGLYLPQYGNVYYGNISSESLSSDFYKNNVAVLFQDYTKYELTLRENLAFGNITDINNDEKMIRILKKLNMTFLKSDEEYDLDIQLGSWFDNARQLSGGEWQRVALARTFMKEAGLYILDEPNSALDPMIEKYILDTFLSLSKDAITIFITHNILAAEKADKIIVMDDGKISGVGDHDFLYKNCSEYKELYDADKYGR